MERITGRTLQALRMRHFSLYPYCVHCAKRGRYVLAVELDHIKPLHKGGEDVESNRQGLCVDCHLIKSKKERGHRVSRKVGIDGYPAVSVDGKETPLTPGGSDKVFRVVR